MTTSGEEIFYWNSRAILRDIGMQHLDWVHGAAVNIVRRSLNVRGRPTHHQQAFMEGQSPALLAYLEKLAASGDMEGWRTLRDRVQRHAELLRETNMQQCSRPWLAAIWHILPELAAIGQAILDREAEKDGPTPDVAPTVTETNGGTSAGEGDKGGAGSAGATAKPRPSSRLALPIAPVILTDAEKTAFGLEDTNTDESKDAAPDGPGGTDGDGGTSGPGGMGGGR